MRWFTTWLYVIQRVILSLIYNNSAFKFNRLAQVSDNRSFCDIFLIEANPFRRVCLFCNFVTNTIYVMEIEMLELVLLQDI